jgi:hypothetical protein
MGNLKVLLSFAFIIEILSKMSLIKNALPILFSMLCLCFSYHAKSQIDTSMVHPELSVKQKPTFALATDIRETLVRNSAITIYGGLVGLNFKDKNFYSIGYYTLSNTSKANIKARNRMQSQSQIAPVTDDVSLWFLSAGYTRTIYHKRFLKIDLPIEFGGGEGSDAVYDADGKLIKLMNGYFFPLQGGVSTIFKVTRWFGIHLQGGYRQVVGKSFFQKEYSGIYYTYGLTVNFGNIYNDLTKK